MHIRCIPVQLSMGWTVIIDVFGEPKASVVFGCPRHRKTAVLAGALFAGELICWNLAACSKVTKPGDAET